MNSYEYWQEREEANRQSNIKEEQEYEKEVERIYKRMLNEIDTQINAWYSKYASDEGITMAEAKRRADKLDIEAYAEKAKKYVKEKDFSPQANAEMKLYNLTMKANRLQLLKANIGAEMVSGHDELQKFYSECLENRTLDEIKRQSGILGDSVQFNAKKVNNIVNASFHNANWSERIWLNQDLLRADLDKILSTALIQGRNPRDFISDVRKRFDVTSSNAERLLRTEMKRVQTDAQMESYKDSGFTEYTFHGLGTACDICSKLNGRHFKIRNAEIGLNSPPMHPNCRCGTSPYIDTTDFDEWLEHVDEGLTFEEWKNRSKTIGIFDIHSGSQQSFKKSLLAISKGEAGLDARRTNILKKINKSNTYCRLEKDSISDRDMAYLSAACGDELALFRSKLEDVLLRGTYNECVSTSFDKKLIVELQSGKFEWVSHTHTDGTLMASDGDRETLKLLRQKRSKIITTDGKTKYFSQSVFDD